MPAALAIVAKAKFDELDSEDVTSAEALREALRGVDISRACHAEIEFTKHIGVSPGGAEHGDRRRQILQALGIPEHDPRRGEQGRTGRRRHGLLDLVQAFHFRKCGVKRIGFRRAASDRVPNCRGRRHNLFDDRSHAISCKIISSSSGSLVVIWFTPASIRRLSMSRSPGRSASTVQASTFAPLQVNLSTRLTPKSRPFSTRSASR